MELLDRQRGCLLGLAIGDALGVPAEFKAPGEFEPITDMRGGGPFNLAPGEWTDDTSMALCLGDEIVEHDSIDPIRLHRRFYFWWQGGQNSHNGRCFDIGNTTRVALYRNKKCIVNWPGEHSPFSFPPDEPHGASNGSIMRLAPVPIRWADSHPVAAENAVLQGRVTHGNIEAIATCLNLTSDLIACLHGAKPEWMISQPIRSTAYCVDTLNAARWAVDTTDNFKDALLKAVNLGDDADTVGAVTGQIAGALYGREGIPQEWLAVLAWADRIDAMAIRLAAADYSGT